MLPKHKAEMEWYMCAVLSVSNFCLQNPSIQKCEYSIFNKKPPAESTVSNVKQVKDCYDLLISSSYKKAKDTSL